MDDSSCFQTLIELLPAISAAGFTELEIYEPHLRRGNDLSELKEGIVGNHLDPVILSSYINLNPAKTTAAEVAQEIELIANDISSYGFKRLRLFPGMQISPLDTDTIATFISRLKRVAERLPNTEILLETHDGSIADSLKTLVRIVRELENPNIGLLFQPTVFTRASSLDQFNLQRSLIRHVHLQNRNPDMSFATLRDGVVP